MGKCANLLVVAGETYLLEYLLHSSHAGLLVASLIEMKSTLTRYDDGSIMTNHRRLNERRVRTREGMHLSVMNNSRD